MSDKSATGVALLKLKYRGTDFHGFARQPGQLTVQGSLEEALSTLFKREVETVCAGRTDAGVHAAAQAVSFEVYEDEELSFRLLRSLNALTHPDMRVFDFQLIPGLQSFSARFDARSRSYVYRIAEGHPALFSRDYVWSLGTSLDWYAMEKAAAHLLGEHDFRSFASAASTKELLAQGLSTSREIKEIQFYNEVFMGETLKVIRIRGNAFMHSMVRIIVGTLVEVGQGKRSPDEMLAILEAQDRNAAGMTAPASGLMLEAVEYAI